MGFLLSNKNHEKIINLLINNNFDNNKFNLQSQWHVITSQ